MPGAVEFAFPIAEFESAQRLRARLEGLPLDAPITVVGGGLTGIETAADGKITGIYAVRNPEKLVAVAVPRRISR